MYQVGHHALAASNQPIFGILTQPIPHDWRSDIELGSSSFIESSHVDFLQAAGARVIPVDYRMDIVSLEKLLGQLNGFYIPGDTKLSFEDPDFTNTVNTVMKWAGDHNDAKEQNMHFPVVGVSYGYMSMIQSQVMNESFYETLRDDQIGESLQQNLNLVPADTFTYDEILGSHLERLFDKITFYNEVDIGITLDSFITNQQLRHLVPVATYDEGSKFDSRASEIVSMVEGTYYPFFGFSYRIDKKQFGFHAMNGEGQSKVDHSKLSIEHAMHVANLIVDEARLSSNRFATTNEESRRLISNMVPETYTLPTPLAYPSEKEYGDFYRTELYLF